MQAMLAHIAMLHVKLDVVQTTMLIVMLQLGNVTNVIFHQLQTHLHYATIQFYVQLDVAASNWEIAILVQDCATNVTLDFGCFLTVQIHVKDVSATLIAVKQLDVLYVTINTMALQIVLTVALMDVLVVLYVVDRVTQIMVTVSIIFFV